MSHEKMIKTAEQSVQCEGFALAVSAFDKTKLYLASYRQQRTNQWEAFETFKREAAKAHEAALMHGAQDLFIASLEEIYNTTQVIAQYKVRGMLYGRSLEMAYDQLNNLIEALWDNLKSYVKKVGIPDGFTFQTSPIYFDLIDLSDLIRLSGVLRKIMKGLPADASLLPNYLQPAVNEFISMDEAEKVIIIKRVNAAVVEANYQANRTKKSQTPKACEVYEMKYLSDKTETERLSTIHGIRFPKLQPFKIAFAFPVEYRERIVRPACEALLKLGFAKDDIFFDEWHPALFAGEKVDSVFRRIYHDESACVVVLLSPNYQDKLWNDNMEWPTVRALINDGTQQKVCFLRVDVDVPYIEGLCASHDVARSVDTMKPAEIAEYISNWYHNHILQKPTIS